jgi:16S rRNA (adenine1518-N6/adenine1519-N6)-dimethyltransferase
VGPQHIVIEVGSGPGDLTAELAGRAGRVFAVEIDGALCVDLGRRFADAANVTVLHQDALTLDVAAVLGPEAAYVVAGNLPYNAGTAIVRHFLESRPPPARMVVMLQQEVADSMLAQPGDMSLLALSVQIYASGRKLFEVAPSAFFPPPKVRSAVIRLDILPSPLVRDDQRPRFFRVARAAFSSRRKQLRNSIAQGLGMTGASSEALITAAGIDPSLRPQELTIDEWLSLSESVDGRD